MFDKRLIATSRKMKTCRRLQYGLSIATGIAIFILLIFTSNSSKEKRMTYRSSHVVPSKAINTADGVIITPPEMVDTSESGGNIENSGDGESSNWWGATTYPTEVFGGSSPYRLDGGNCIDFRRSPDVFQAKGCKQRLPGAMVVGVKKCGTATLRSYLRYHPAVSMVTDETKYPGWYNLTSADVDAWRRKMLFSTSVQLTMTECPGYLRFPKESMQRLRPRLLPDTKLIVIIRDPVDRSISDYVHWLVILNNQGLVHLPLSPNQTLYLRGHARFMKETFRKTVLDPETGIIKDDPVIVAFGRYVEGLRNLASVFGRENILILDGAAFIKDPFPILKEVERFLNLPLFFKRNHFQMNLETGFYCVSIPAGSEAKCADPSNKGRTHPSVDSDTLAMLRDYYRPFNAKLAAEFNMSFPWLFV